MTLYAPYACVEGGFLIVLMLKENVVVDEKLEAKGDLNVRISSEVFLYSQVMLLFRFWTFVQVGVRVLKLERLALLLYPQYGAWMTIVLLEITGRVAVNLTVMTAKALTTSLAVAQLQSVRSEA